MRRKACAQSAGSERGDHVKKYAIERGIGHSKQSDGGNGHDARPPQHHADRQADSIRGDAALIDNDVLVAPGLSERREEQDG